MQRRRWSTAGGVVESSDLKCSASVASVLHRNYRIHLWWPALAHSACQEGSAHVRKVSHTPSPAQESRPVHSTDGIRRLRHHGTSLSISTVSLVFLSTLSHRPYAVTEAAEPDDAVGYHGRACVYSHFFRINLIPTRRLWKDNKLSTQVG